MEGTKRNKTYGVTHSQNHNYTHIHFRIHTSIHIRFRTRNPLRTRITCKYNNTHCFIANGNVDQTELYATQTVRCIQNTLTVVFIVSLLWYYTHNSNSGSQLKYLLC